MNILIISNIKRDLELTIAKRVERQIVSSGCSAEIAELSEFYENVPVRPKLSGYDYVIILGGDGSVLCAAPDAAIAGVPILSVNLGFVGYLSAFGEAGLEQSLARFLSGGAEVQSRLMLDVDGKLALNEAVIHRGASTRPISLEFFGERLRGDGLIIATPTGSTAYSFAAGGQSAEPGESALLLTPICAQYPSRKLPGLAEIRVTLTGEVPAMLSLDGKTPSALLPGDTIIVKKASASLKLVRLKG